LLDEVLLREPDHTAAAALRQTLVDQQAAQKPDPALRHSDIPEPPDATWATSEGESEWARLGIEEEVIPDESVAAEAEAIAAIETLVPASEVRISPVLVEVAAAAIVEQNAPEEGAVAADAIPSALDNEIHGASAGNTDEELAATFEGVSVLPAMVGVTESMIPDPEVEQDEAPPMNAVSTPDYGEVLLYRREASSIACHWWLDDATWDEWEARRDGHWIIRILEVSSAEGPFECDESDLILPGTSGEVLCNDLEPNAQVRMAIGWKTVERFYPVLIGVEIAGDAPDRLQVAWQPLPGLEDPAPETWLRCARDCWRALSAEAV
jgi:hypothetical protein